MQLSSSKSFSNCTTSAAFGSKKEFRYRNPRCLKITVNLWQGPKLCGQNEVNLIEWRLPLNSKLPVSQDSRNLVFPGLVRLLDSPKLPCSPKRLPTPGLEWLKWYHVQTKLKIVWSKWFLQLTDSKFEDTDFYKRSQRPGGGVSTEMGISLIVSIKPKYF